METGNPLGDFLRAKRELISPESAGLPATARRRVRGLRREEAAQLAGISTEHYLRIEQGGDQSPPNDVLEGLARALQLDDNATAYLHQVAHPPTGRRRDTGVIEKVSESLITLIAAWPNQAVFIEGRLMDVLAANPLAMSLSPAFTPGTNGLRSAFLDPEVRELHHDWEATVARTIAGLRAFVGPNVDDPRFAQLIGELSVRSDDFRRLWAQQDVRVKRYGTSLMHHPQVGDLDLNYERFAIDGSDGQVLVVLHAEPGTPSEQAFRQLAVIASGRTTAEGARPLTPPVPIESKRRLP